MSCQHGESKWEIDHVHSAWFEEICSYELIKNMNLFGVNKVVIPIYSRIFKYLREVKQPQKNPYFKTFNQLERSKELPQPIRKPIGSNVTVLHNPIRWGNLDEVIVNQSKDWFRHILNKNHSDEKEAYIVKSKEKKSFIEIWIIMGLLLIKTHDPSL